MAAMATYGGIDLGGTKIQAVVVDDGSHRARLRAPADAHERRAGRTWRRRWRTRCATRPRPPRSSRRALDGIGVGSPGTIDGRSRDQRAQPARTGKARSRWRRRSKARSGREVRVGNDVQVATDAEFKLGAGRPYDSLLGVFWGTGVGGGLILDGKPWIGRGGAGEIGHMVVEIDGARCTCGRRGCMEAYAGRAAMELHARKLHEEKGRKTDLFKLMREHERTRLTSGIWARALEHGDKLATEIIDRAVRALGAGIASAVNLLDVEAVIIGGGLGVRLGDPYAKRIAEAMQPHLFADVTASARARRRARRPRRRDRRGAAGRAGRAPGRARLSAPRRNAHRCSSRSPSRLESARRRNVCRP